MGVVAGDCPISAAANTSSNDVPTFMLLQPRSCEAEIGVDGGWKQVPTHIGQGDELVKASRIDGCEDIHTCTFLIFRFSSCFITNG